MKCRNNDIVPDKRVGGANVPRKAPIGRPVHDPLLLCSGIENVTLGGYKNDPSAKRLWVPAKYPSACDGLSAKPGTFPPCRRTTGRAHPPAGQTLLIIANCKNRSCGGARLPSSVVTKDTVPESGSASQRKKCPR